MKLLSTLLCLALLAGHGVAATHAPKKAPAKPPTDPAVPAATAPAPDEPLPVSDPAVPVPPCKLKVDDYFSELIEVTKLTDFEKKSVEDIYFADGKTLTALLNDASLSPIQKAEEASELRNMRNHKIEALLVDLDRRQAFLLVEAKYRVALLELAAEGGLVPPPPPEKK